jgi:hypothetical protein
MFRFIQIASGNMTTIVNLDYIIRIHKNEDDKAVFTLNESNGYDSKNYRQLISSNNYDSAISGILLQTNYLNLDEHE